ncbi:tetratricopeptide repeat protein [bacterium]|nr:tetratricopeptide repeat protein [bacterium]
MGGRAAAPRGAVSRARRAETKLKKARKLLQALQSAEGQKDEVLVNAFLLESELLIEHGKATEASAVLSDGLARFADDANLLYARAMAGIKLKDVVQMEADFRRMIELDPENANAWNALGYSLLTETDRTEEAVNLIERAYQLEPSNGAIVDSLGWGFFKMGQLDQAISYLREAYKLTPEGEIAAHLAEALSEMGAVDEAQQLATEAKAKFPSSAPLLETIKRLKLQTDELAPPASHELRQ